MSLVLPRSRATFMPGWVRNDLWRRARAVPSLDLRFADRKSLVDAISGQNLVTFTRASSGTYVGSDGLLKTATTNEPRFDHNPTTGESLGLLVEEQRTNLLLRSEEFALTWIAGGTTIASDSQTAPNGTNTADTITVTEGTAVIYQTVSCAASTTYTFSFYLKLGTMPASDFRFAVRDDSNGAFIDQNIVPNVTPVSTEWRRVSYTFTTPVGCVLVRPYLYRFTFVTGGTFHIWGAQLEAGAFPTSYIPTTDTAATRNADVASITGTAFSSWYRQDEGTMFASYRLLAGSISSVRTIANLNNAPGLDQNTTFISASNTISQNTFVSGVSQGRLDSGPPAANTLLRNAFNYANGVREFSVGGGAVVVGTGSIAAATRLSLGNYASSTFLNGTIGRFAYFPQRLPNATLQALTQ